MSRITVLPFVYMLFWLQKFIDLKFCINMKKDIVFKTDIKIPLWN